MGLVARGVFGALLVGVAVGTAGAGLFHGLNAGAPIWNGDLIFTAQKAGLIAATGTHSIRVNFRLDPGHTSWDAAQLNLYDHVIANARGAGLEVLGLWSNESVAGGQAAWNDDADLNGRNAYVDNFASTAAFLADRYRDDIRQWEVWNEPNAWTNPNHASDPQNAGGTYMLPRVYAELQSQTFRSLDNAGLIANGLSLVSGGLLAHDIGGSFSTAMDYMQQVYARDAVWDSLSADTGRRYPWNEFGYHFYLNQGEPVSPSELGAYFNNVRSGKTAQGDFTPITVTEFGWQTVGTNTEQLQRDNMAGAYDFLEAQSDVARTFWYQWEDEPGGGWGIVHGNGAHKLSYDEFAVRNGGPPSGQPTQLTQHALDDASLGTTFSSTDLLQGRIPSTLPGDNGWHPVNPAATNPADPNGLPAFTDGVGDLGGGVTGLLNDFPGDGLPTKLVDYDLGVPQTIDEIRIFTGNNGRDGRIFSTTVVRYSTDGGESYQVLGYFQSDESGATNNGSTPGGPLGSTLVSIFNDAGLPLLEGVTNLQFDFYAVDNLGGQMRDPFNGTNPFTGTNDGFSAPFVSPLVREIDVFGAQSYLTGDANLDGQVTGADYTIWADHFGASGALWAEGDFNGDHQVTGADFTLWADHFGASRSAAAVPEPSTLVLLVALALALGAWALLPAPGRAMTRANRKDVKERRDTKMTPSRLRVALRLGGESS